MVELVGGYPSYLAAGGLGVSLGRIKWVPYFLKVASRVFCWSGGETPFFSRRILVEFGGKTERLNQVFERR